MRLSLLEELKTIPFGSVWDYYCQKKNILMESEVIDNIHEYENKVTNKRN